MWERLELRADIQRMVVSLAENAIGSRVSSTCGEGHYKLSGRRIPLHIMRFTPLGSLVTGN